MERDRATCWSITINNPTEEDIQPRLPAGWTFQGQPEKGEQGTEHFQGMLFTPQVRFSAVKKVFPRAHIEIARNRNALANYVQKDETRNGEYRVVRSEIPTLFDYQTTVAKKFNRTLLYERYSQRLRSWTEAGSASAKIPDIDEMAMEYLDELVAQDIENGLRGVEYIAINPMWRSSWKKFWRVIIKRDGSQQTQSSPQADEASAQTQDDAE